jgi:hypothetical protein
MPDWIMLCLPALTACVLHLIVLGKYRIYGEAIRVISLTTIKEKDIGLVI